jgi:hypothetical protein
MDKTGRPGRSGRLFFMENMLALRQHLRLDCVVEGNND